MTLQRDFSGWKLAIRNRATRRGTRRSFAALLGAAALAFAGSQAGCNDGGSPTAPPPPQTLAPLERVVVGASYTLLVTPINESRNYPRGGELLLDGRSLWAGAMSAPPTCCDYYYYYETPANIVVADAQPLSEGHHTLTFRVTDQQRSPTGYSLSGRVDVSWQSQRNGVRVGIPQTFRAADWQDAQARLRTGDAWSIEFVVPALSSL